MSVKHAWLVLAACGGGNAKPMIDAARPDAAIDASPVQCGTIPATCGPSHDKSCCASDVVPGGTFLRDDDAGSDGAYTDTNDPATVSAFRLDTYEITVARFRAFVDAGGGTQASAPAAGAGAHPHLPASGWDPAWNAKLPADRAALVTSLACQDTALRTWTDAPSDNDERPINCVSWYEAMAFCTWDGGYLPTQAEWLFAAYGGDEQRAYPWSSPPGDLTIDATHASDNCLGDGHPWCWVTDLLAVGTLPAGNGKWGTANMADNVMEWVIDTMAPFSDPCVDCAGLGSGNKMAMGDEFENTIPRGHRTSFGQAGDPATTSVVVGARCARSP